MYALYVRALVSLLFVSSMFYTFLCTTCTWIYVHTQISHSPRATPYQRKGVASRVVRTWRALVGNGRTILAGSRQRCGRKRFELRFRASHTRSTPTNTLFVLLGLSQKLDCQSISNFKLSLSVTNDIFYFIFLPNLRNILGKLRDLSLESIFTSQGYDSFSRTIKN